MEVMKPYVKYLGKGGAILAFSCCFAGGLCVLGSCKGKDLVGVGWGLYFIGKAFFVGPMLWLATEQLELAWLSHEQHNINNTTE